MTPKEWTLIDRYMTGTITYEEFALMQRLLYESEELRSAFRKAASLDIGLHDLHSMDPKQSDLLAFDFSNVSKSVIAPARGWAHNSIWQLAATIAVILALGQYFFSLRDVPVQIVAQRLPAVPSEVVTVDIATVIHTSECVWTRSAKPLAVGDSLSAGEVELGSGTLVFAIHNGPRIVLTGPAKFILHSKTKAYLDHGYLSFQNFLNSNSFDLTTPQSLLSDIGTEYAVSVNEGGEVIHVVGGEVWRTNLAEQDDVSFIGKGETQVIGSNQDTDKLLSFIETTRSSLQETDNTLQQPIASDSFEYREEAGGDTANLAGGTGWQGPWKVTLRKFDNSTLKTDRLKVDAGQGVGLTTQSSSTGIGLSGDSVMNRALAEPISMEANATCYISLHYNTSAFAEGDRMALLLKLNDSFNRKDLTLGINGDKRLLCRFDGSAKSLNPVSATGEMLLVARITAHKNDNATVDIVMLDPTATLTTEPTEWDLNRGIDLNKTLWDTLTLHVFSKKPVNIEEVRVSRTWRGLLN
ncbi:hypothetical protein IMCC26134_05000 [Verrucomicrobia bacterium IMCC26134]|nr:hypothetical protein IMCC26134_05000 [Verrucomicrobia bacterium IMCC26134]